MVEEAGDGEGTDAADFGGDGGEVGAVAEAVGDIAFQDAFFAGGAGVDDDGAGGNELVRNQPRYTRCAYDYIKFCEICQVVAAMKEGDIVA